MAIKKRHGVQWHKKKAWDAYSLMKRLQYADKNGMVKCVTCGCVKHYKSMQAGHFLAGRGNSILFENNNVHPQCYSCNVMNHGEQLKYYRFMVKTYGEAEVKRLEKLKAKTRSFTIPELIKMREEFEANTHELRTS